MLSFHFVGQTPNHVVHTRALDKILCRDSIRIRHGFVLKLALNDLQMRYTLFICYWRNNNLANSCYTLDDINRVTESSWHSYVNFTKRNTHQINGTASKHQSKVLTFRRVFHPLRGKVYIKATQITMEYRLFEWTDERKRRQLHLFIRKLTLHKNMQTNYIQT